MNFEICNLLFLKFIDLLKLVPNSNLINTYGSQIYNIISERITDLFHTHY